MNVRKTLTGLFAFLLLTAVAFAEDPKPAAKPADGAEPAKAEEPKVDPEILKLFLMDGSMVTGKLSVKDIELETQFGKLTIPVTEIRSFTPGLGSHPDLGKKVADLIEKLGSTEFDEREASQKELVKLGASVRKELEKRGQDSDNERRMRIKNILAELDDQRDDDDADNPNPVDRSSLIQNDTVETSQFTVVGRIVSGSFTITTNFGPLNVKLADIRSGQHDVGKKPDARKTITVDNTNFVQRGYKDTGVRVERGDKVTVSAEGTMTLTPWGHNAMSTPDGNPQYGWYMPNSMATGCLVASIGPNDPFKVGSKSTFKAAKSGVLRFAIAIPNEYVNNQPFPGKYTVKIRVEHN